MPRLVVNPGSGEAWEIQLQPGPNSIGRGPDNDFPLLEDSVSTSHCRIHCENGRAVIQDLGSANGTFVNHEPVSQSVLKSGQKVHIGNVELDYYADEQPAESKHTAPGALPAVFTEPKFCKIHLQTPASFFCPKCRGLFCDICVGSSGGARKFCRKCGCECVPARIELVPQRVRSFYSFIPGAFAYPLRGDGALMLLVGTVLMGAIHFAAGTGKFNSAMTGGIPISWWSLMLQVMATGYLFCYMQNIIHSTVIGEKNPPSLPDITSFWDDILLPCLQLIGVTLISFAPMILLDIVLIATGSQVGAAISMSVLVLGCVYFPMAFLAVALLDNVAAANPLQVVPSILKVPAEYFTALCALALVFIARAAGDVVLHLLFPRELLTHSASRLLLMLALNAIWAFVSFYLLTVGIRILGLLYVIRKETLGWLNH